MVNSACSIKSLMSTKKKKYVLLSGAVILIALILFVGVYILRKSGNLRFYEPISVSIQKTDSVDTQIVGVEGLTPFGRRIAFSKSSGQWQSWYGFLSHIEISISQSLIKSEQPLKFLIGADSTVLSIKELSQTWTSISVNDSTICLLSPDSMESRGSTVEFLGSVYNWTSGKYLFYFILGLFGLLLLVFIIRDIKPSMITKTNVFRFILIVAGVTSMGVVLYFMCGLHKIHMCTGLFLIVAAYSCLYFLIQLIFFKKIRLKTNLQLLLGVIFLFLFIIEFFLRFSSYKTYAEVRTGYYQSPYEPQVHSWYYTRSNYKKFTLDSPEFSFDRDVNSLGLSDDEPSLSKDSNEYRILGIGDSFTEGDGASKDSTWLKFLEYQLRKKYPERKFSFINAGESGSDPFFEYVLLRDKLLKYKPDLVIPAFGIDLEDVMIRGGMERFRADSDVEFHKAPSFEPLYSLFYSVRLIIHRVFGYNKLLISPASQEQGIKEYAVDGLMEAGQQFKDLAEKNHFKLLFVVYPQKSEVVENNYMYWNRIIPALQTENTPVVDLLKYYRNTAGVNETNFQQYYWVQDGHHNAKGYRLFADGVLEKLEASGFLIDDSLQRAKEALY